MSRKAWFYVIFFAGLCIGFYYVLKTIIPGYGDVKLPVLTHVQPFRFISHQGKTITENDVSGKVYVAEYFFTTCQGICPKMNNNLKSIFESYKQEPRFAILSHTCDPETDDVERLKEYADSMDVHTGNWLFLTGSKDSLYHAARVSYLLDDPKNNNLPVEEQFMHTQFFALVDKSGRLRKIYDGLKKDEIVMLKKDIGILLKEPIVQKRL